MLMSIFFLMSNDVLVRINKYVVMILIYVGKKYIIKYISNTSKNYNYNHKNNFI